jgi:hypothetical protein
MNLPAGWGRIGNYLRRRPDYFQLIEAVHRGAIRERIKVFTQTSPSMQSHSGGWNPSEKWGLPGAFPPPRANSANFWCPD